MPKTINDLSIGAKVKDVNTLCYGSPVIWQIIDKNHSGYPENSVTLITERSITMRPFDAKEANNANSNRKNYGNNRYSVSNIRQWLNSDAATGAWYSAQHGADAPPTAANITNGNAYDTDAGFLNSFSTGFKNAILNTTITIKKTSADGGGSETIEDKMFLASVVEIGYANTDGGAEEGTILAAFSNDASRIAYVTTEGISNSSYASKPANNTTAWGWWLRTPYNAVASYPSRVRYSVPSGGQVDFLSANDGRFGVRPLCNLPSSVVVSDAPESDGCYTIIWNAPPTEPSGITTPGTIHGGSSVEVSWGASTDSDGSIGGYILERATNGGAFTQIYKGISRTYTDTIATGLTKVQYRVKAYDNNNAESAYKTAAAQNVVNSNPPVISGSNSSLGAKTGAFSQTYSVTNPDSGLAKVLTVVEKIDGKQKRSYTATSGATNTFSVTADEWIKTVNGSHTLTITATDNYGGTATRTYSFTKNETQIELTLATPLSADAAVTKGIMNVSRQIPSGAAFSVEVCNNAFDASPAWENVTAAVIAGSKFFLSNASKTATKWGFNIRIKANRGTATGDCFINGIGGNFE